MPESAANDVEEVEHRHLNGGRTVPKPVAEFYDDPLSGLFPCDNPGGDGVLLYDSTVGISRIGGRAGVEIPTDNPRIIDESREFPDVEPPRCSFDQLVAEYGLTYEVVDGFTYVYLAEGDR